MEAGTSRSWPPCVEVIDDRTASMLRALTPQARLAAANTMSVQYREMAQHAIRTAHPEWVEERVLAEYLKRTGIWAQETFWRKRRDDSRAGKSDIS